MTYRLHRRDAVISGKWYSAVKCKGCAQHIILLQDSSKGTKNMPVEEEARFSIPCHSCFHDDIYTVDNLYSLEVQESIPATYPERAEISSSQKKALTKFYPNAKVTMGVGFIEDRPKAAMLVGRIVTSWADIEIQYTRLLAELMQTNIPAVSAVFGTLRTSQSQSNAVLAAAEVVLEQDDLTLLQAYNNRKAILAKERNDLAHGCFGVSVSIPEHIVWISQADFLALNAARVGKEVDLDLSSKQFIYEIGTLERIAQEIIEFYHQVGAYTGYLLYRHNGEDGLNFKRKRYPQLCDQPHIKQELNIIKKNKKQKKVK